ncbi:MAG: hydroxyisourate hydrolase [Pseudomonadales bacterium]|jgi:5-hydroxyisourate hydrolase
MSISASLSTHILDLERGMPAVGVSVTVTAKNEGAYAEVHRGVTDNDGRIKDWSPGATLSSGLWELRFDVGSWYRSRGETSFYPHIVICFEVDGTHKHLHVPLLLNRYGYTTYRGS